MVDLRYLERAGLGDMTGTTIMLTERVRRVMDIMATEPVVPEVRAVALRELTRMLGVAADVWAGPSVPVSRYFGATRAPAATASTAPRTAQEALALPSSRSTYARRSETPWEAAERAARGMVPAA